MNSQTPNTVAGIVAIVKANLASGTAVLGPTHYDNNGQPIDLSGRKASQITNKRRRFTRHNRPERRSELQPIQGLFLSALPLAGSNDERHFPRVESALVVTDSRTGKAITLDNAEEALLFCALEECRKNGNENAARLAARLDAL